MPGIQVPKEEPNNSIAGADSGKTEAECKEEKQAPAVTLTSPTPNKPAKRRITPMAID